MKSQVVTAQHSVRVLGDPSPRGNFSNLGIILCGRVHSGYQCQLQRVCVCVRARTRARVRIGVCVRVYVRVSVCICVPGIRVRPVFLMCS